MKPALTVNIEQDIEQNFVQKKALNFPLEALLAIAEHKDATFLISRKRKSTGADGAGHSEILEDFLDE